MFHPSLCFIKQVKFNLFSLSSSLCWLVCINLKSIDRLLRGFSACLSLLLRKRRVEAEFVFDHQVQKNPGTWIKAHQTLNNGAGSPCLFPAPELSTSLMRRQNSERLTNTDERRFHVVRGRGDFPAERNDGAKQRTAACSDEELLSPLPSLAKILSQMMFNWQLHQEPSSSKQQTGVDCIKKHSAAAAAAAPDQPVRAQHWNEMLSVRNSPPTLPLVRRWRRVWVFLNLSPFSKD